MFNAMCSNEPAVEKALSNGGEPTAETALPNGSGPSFWKVPKHITVIPLKKTSNDSSNVMDQDNKKIECMRCVPEVPFSVTNMRTSKEVTMTPTMNTANNVISIIKKKLPGITLNLVQQESVFKVPKIPKKPNIIMPIQNTEPDRKRKVEHNKNILSERKRANTVVSSIFFADKYEKMINNNSKPKTSQAQKQYQEDMYYNWVSEKKNMPRTSSPKRVFRKFFNFNSSIKNQQFMSEKKISNNHVVLNELIKNNGLNMSNPTNNKEIKTIEPINEDNTLTDVSTKGKINNGSPTSTDEYDKFVLGVNGLKNKVPYTEPR